MTPSEVAIALRQLHASKVPSPSGPSPQTMGFQMYRIKASGSQLWALIEAAEMLDSQSDRGGKQ